MPLVYYNLYKDFIQGSVSYYGNSIGLSKASNALSPGTTYGMGTFITVDTILRSTPAWPLGTTFTIANNSSDAFVQWEADSTVKAAHLMWGGGYGQAPGGAAIANYPIWMQDPSGTKTTLVRDRSIIGTHSTGEAMYFNSVDVTTIVKNIGEGRYIVGSIPCQLIAAPIFPSHQMAGWTLAVVYENKLLPLGYCYVILTNQDAPGTGGAPYDIFIPIGGTTPMKFCAAFLGAFPTNGSYGFGFFSGYTLPPPYNHPYNVISHPWRPNTAYSFCNFAGGVIDNYNGSSADYNSIFGNRVTSLIPPVTLVSGARMGIDIINKNTFATPRTQIQLDLIQSSYALSFGYITLVNNALASLIKSVNKTVASAGETIIYTIKLTLSTASNGSGNSNNVAIYDSIPVGTTFVTNSVYRNGINLPGVNPQTGISIGYVTLPYSVTINFSVTVNSPIIVTSIPNSALAVYGATIPSPTIPSTNILMLSNIRSNEVLTEFPPLNLMKNVDKSYADLSEVVTYNIVASALISALSNVTVIDTLPNGYTVVPGSLLVNGVPNAGNLSTGINVGNIPTGGKTTITFNVNTPSVMPVPNTIVNSAIAFDDSSKVVTSNIVTTTINSGILYQVKRASIYEGTLGDTIVYTVTIVNIGNQPSINSIFIDTVPSGTSFINGSVWINNVNNPLLSINAPGINLGTIAAGSLTTISFSVLIESIPQGNVVLNSSNVSSHYYVDPLVKKDYSNISNITSTTVLVAKFDSLTKYVDKVYSVLGDTITYTIVSKNSGNITANNCVYLDTLSSGLVYVPGTLQVNGVNVPGSPTNIQIGSVQSGEVVTITFVCIIN